MVENTQTPIGDLEQLRRRLDGTLLLPDEPGYREAAETANGRYHHILPLAVAQCAGEADVVTCVQWCIEYGVQPVARGGGHSYAGFAASEGLMVDIRRLNSVSIDPATGIATVGGSALNSDLFEKTVNTDYILPGGTCLSVGVGGLVLGGGIGYNTRWAGLTCDHLISSRIVTAVEKEPLTIDPKHHERLFWACRGGAGGSFGINTEFTFQLVQVPIERVAHYHFEWRGADAAEAVLGAFDRLLPGVPPEFNAVARAQAVPLLPGEGQRDAIHVMSRGHYLGPIGELEQIIQPLLAVTPTQQLLEEKCFWDMQEHWTSGEPESHSFGDISRYASQPLPSGVTSDFVQLLAECPHRSDAANGSMWSLGWVGGAIVDKFSPTDTAYVHRNMSTLLRPTIVWPNGEEQIGRDLQDWADAMIAVIADSTPNRSYQNFPNRSLEDWQRAYYGQNLEQLVKVKATYDPDDLFNNPQSIPVSL